MKIRHIKKGLVLLTIASGMFAVGCELIVDFDRTKIPVDVNEASVPDSSTTNDGATNDAGNEAAADADATTADADATVADADADADQ